MKTCARAFRFALLSFALAFSAIAHAQGVRPTIVISDIDDTIQNTKLRSGGKSLSQYVVHYWGFVTGLLSSHDAFVGMPALYTALAMNGREVRYVSGTPKVFSSFAEKFLQTSGFPVGELSVRPSTSVSTEEFKVARISEILLAHPDTRFILIGDNGERDIVVYRRLKADPRFSNQIDEVYIHSLYPVGIGLAVEQGQHTYLTAADLAIQLQQAGDISTAQAVEVLKLVDAGLVSRFSPLQDRTFPRYAVADPNELACLFEQGQQLAEPELRSTFMRIVAKLTERAAPWAAGSCRRSDDWGNR